MKRITYWPQAWLGICMNFGLVVAWAAVTGGLDTQLLAVLMAGTWGWTMHYGQPISSPFRMRIQELMRTISIRYHLCMPGPS